jgi:hypothetical protein
MLTGTALIETYVGFLRLSYEAPQGFYAQRPALHYEMRSALNPLRGTRRVQALHECF